MEPSMELQVKLPNVTMLAPPLHMTLFNPSAGKAVIR